MSARGLARHYAMLANWGELDGVRILPEARIRAGIELQSFEWDEVYWVRVRRCLGYRRGSDTGPLASPRRVRSRRRRRLFGYADPSKRLAIGFAKNYFTYATGGAVNAGRPPRSASNVVAEAVFDALGLKRASPGWRARSTRRRARAEADRPGSVEEAAREVVNWNVRCIRKAVAGRRGGSVVAAAALVASVAWGQQKIQRHPQGGGLRGDPAAGGPLCLRGGHARGQRQRLRRAVRARTACSARRRGPRGPCQAGDEHAGRARAARPTRGTT